MDNSVILSEMERLKEEIDRLILENKEDRDDSKELAYRRVKEYVTDRIKFIASCSS